MDFKDVLKEVIFAIGLMLFIILAMFLSVTSSYEIKNTVDKYKETDTPIIYDTPSSKLKEGEYICPECGEISWGINGDVVCRNEDCPNYGLAVPVEMND